MMAGMAKKLQEVLKQAETWPEAAAEELADAALEIGVNLQGEYRATAEELAGIDRGLGDAQQWRFATDDEVRVAFGTFRCS
jgi:hypothetical protein